MQLWWQLATRNWRTKPGRTALTTLAVALGVGVVVWVTCCYESVRRSVTQVVLEWVGAAHVVVEPVEGVWGVFDGDLEAQIAALPGVAQTTVRTREYVDAAPAPRVDTDRGRTRYVRIEVTGVVPEKESAFRTYKLLEGRFIAPGDKDVLVIEKLLAEEFEVGLGDRIVLRSLKDLTEKREFRVIGIVDRRRASVNQAPMTWASLAEVESLVQLPGRIKGIDVMLHDTSVASIQSSAATIRNLIDERNRKREQEDREPESIQVKTTETQHKKLGAAQGLLQFIMMLLSCVVLLTALFIILASMNMGVTERIAELGLLRCVGVTRRQVAAVVGIQVLPLGLLGTFLGVPLGLALQALTIELAGEYLGEMVISRWGVGLACLGGVGTTLIGAALPAFSAMTVSPVEAARVAGGHRWTPSAWLTAVVGLLFFAIHAYLLRNAAAAEEAALDLRAMSSVFTLYAGCALIAPAVIRTIGRCAVHVAALLLRLRPQLLGDEIDRAPFRSASICCGLAVGLSLIVGLIVWGQSVKAGWQFPSEFPDAMLYSYEPLPLHRVRALKDTPGIRDFTVCDDFAFSFSRPSRLSLFRSLSALEQSSRFLAIEPEEGLRVVKLTFLEGDERGALEKLRQGGHALVTREFAQARNKHLGDSIEIWVGQHSATFVIAGVVGSAGVDIAISFFNATEFFQFYAVGAIFGTLDDAQRLFGRNYGKMMLFNFDLPEEDRTRIVNRTEEAAVQFPEAAPPGMRQTFAMGPGPIPEAGPQEAIVNRMLKELGHPSKAFVTARELKTQIDDQINRVTLLLSAIPAVGLLIAALGVANLMAANVASRARQIAVLRAIGVTRRQMFRMVIGEAAVLGLIGSLLGVGLGLLLAGASNTLTAALTGFEPVFAMRWDMVGLGAGLATLLCMAAALLPAARASRTQIVSALASAG